MDSWDNVLIFLSFSRIDSSFSTAARLLDGSFSTAARLIDGSFSNAARLLDGSFSTAARLLVSSWVFLTILQNYKIIALMNLWLNKKTQKFGKKTITITIKIDKWIIKKVS